MTETTKVSPALPSAGGSYALVKGKLVRVPEDEQQIHAADPKAAPANKSKE